MTITVGTRLRPIASRFQADLHHGWCIYRNVTDSTGIARITDVFVCIELIGRGYIRLQNMRTGYTTSTRLAHERMELVPPTLYTRRSHA